MSSVESVVSKRHTKKSRGGCFNCKARKIKCSETRPACEGCQTRDLFCTYPTKAQQRNIRRQNIGPVTSTEICPPLAPVNPSFTSFKAKDFEYFFHFLTVAYPALPYNNDSAWTTNIPQFSHHYTPLLHAILALGASNSAILAPGPEKLTDAVHYRGLALSGLRQALAKADHTDVELDVMLAICYALTFQSAYMTDGIADFVIMIRGCYLVTMLILGRSSSTTFSLDPSRHFQAMLRRLQTAPCLDAGSLQEGIKSLELVLPHVTVVAHRQFYHAVLQTLRGLQRSAPDAYTWFIRMYIVWYTMDEPAFISFIDPDNSATQVLFTYFTAILMLMQVYLSHETPGRLSSPRMVPVTSDWLDSIVRRLPTEFHGYVNWPFGVVRAFCSNREAFGEDVAGLAHWSLKAAGSQVGQTRMLQIMPPQRLSAPDDT